MESLRLPLLLIIVCLAACEHINNVKSVVDKKLEARRGKHQRLTVERPKKRSRRDGPVVNKRKDGSVLSEITVKDSRPHGPAKDYYEDGTLHADFMYVEGVLENDLKWYHKNGNLYKITPLSSWKNTRY